MTQLIMASIAFLLVLFTLPWLPVQITMKGKIVLVAVSAGLAAFLLFSLSLFTLWPSLLAYMLLALAAAYAAGTYGFPIWALEETHPEMQWIEEELELNDPKKVVPLSQNRIKEEVLEQEPNFDEPEENKPLFMLEEDDIEPAPAIEEKDYDISFDEDDYILSLYSDEGELADASLADQLSGGGQSDYLAELLSEIEETEKASDDDMEEIPLLHLEEGSEQKKSPETH